MLGGLSGLTLGLLAAVALGGLGVLWVVFRRWPLAGLVFWLVTVCLMPVWWAIPLVVEMRPATLGGLVLLTTFIGRFPRVYGLADLGVALLFIAALFPMLFGGASVSSVFGLASQWILGYLLGRLVLRWVGQDRTYATVAISFTIVAALAIAEFVLRWNPWSQLGPHNALYAIWGSIQYRAGLPRSEGAFGHSIALGCSMAMAVPFIFATRFRSWVRFGMASLVMVATVVTFSRGALLSAGLSCAIVALLGGRDHNAPARRTAGLVLLVGALVSIPVITSVIAHAGDEAGTSADYRGRLLDLVSAMQPLGVSEEVRTSITGERYIGNFQSIDSQLILTGLTYGWMVLGLGLLLLGMAAILVLTGKASPGVIAVVGQLPALASVALITQYNIWFWFVAGLGVAALAQYQARDAEVALVSAAAAGPPGAESFSRPSSGTGVVGPD